MRVLLRGGGTYLGTLVISGGSEDVTVTNCTFAHNDGGQFFDIYHGVLDANGGGAGVVIQNNVFFDNNLPLSISDLFSIDDSNVFHDPDNVSVTNTCNGIFVYTGSVDSPISWGETEVAFVIDDVDWWIGGFGTLTLSDNVVLKFTEDGTLSMIYGTGLVNYLGAGVYFTSFNDDARKGDTNGDGLSVGVDDYWTGIYNDEPGPIGEWWTYGNILYDTDHP